MILLNFFAKKILSNDIIFVGDSNMTKLIKDYQTTFMLVLDTEEDFKKLRFFSDFLSISNTLNSRCNFAILDASRNFRTKKRFNIKDERTYLLFRNGNFTCKYEGKKTAEKIIDFIISKTGIPFKTFDDFVVAQEFIESNDYSVIFYSLSTKDKNFEKYNKLSLMLRDEFSFGFCPDEVIADELKIDKFPSLVFYKRSDGSVLFFDDDFSTTPVEDIRDWLIYNKRPSFTKFKVFDQDSYRGGKPVAVFFTPVDVKKQNKNHKLITELYTKFGNDILFTAIDAVTGSRFMVNIGFSKYADPAVAIIEFKRSETLKYLYDEEAEWNINALSEFFENYLDKKLKPYVKSYKLPLNQTGPIFETSSKSFKEDVYKYSGNVVVLYYEPWDRLYNEFLPVYNDIAGSFKSFKFLKISVSENDLLQGPNPSKTPSLYLFLSGSKKKPIYYNDELKKDAFIEFLEFNGADLEDL